MTDLEKKYFNLACRIQEEMSLEISLIPYIESALRWHDADKFFSEKYPILLEAYQEAKHGEILPTWLGDAIEQTLMEER